MAWLLIAVVAGAEPIAVQPVWQRLSLPPGGQSTYRLAISAPAGTSVLAVNAECPCVRVKTLLPVVVGSTPASVELLVTSALPGIKAITVATTAGTSTVWAQIAVEGHGDGAAVLEQARAEAKRQGWSIWAIVHDLHGEIRNCGCAQGSLGGIDLLAALPASAPEVRWMLSGNSDGQRPGVEAALLQKGWKRDDAAVVTTEDSASAIARNGVVVVMTSASKRLAHAKVVVPALTHGMAAELLLMDDQRRIRNRLVMPIDRSLAVDKAIMAGFTDVFTGRWVDSKPSTDCASCHAEAHRVWAGSTHSLALERLPVADRTDSCVGCHSLITAPAADHVPAARVGGVHCQSCHQGADAHAVGGSEVKTLGVTDCRSCHDARHDPGFDPVAAWKRIAHGK